MRRARFQLILRRRRRAFTLFELLVVIAIILVLVVITVPAISTIAASASFSGAVNLVTATLGSARSRAISGDENTAVGVAFYLDIQTQRYTLQVVEREGSSNYFERFIPAPGIAPVELPAGIIVFGLSFDAGDGWYDEPFEHPDQPNWTVNPWILPRNDPRLFIDDDDLNDPLTRETLTDHHIWDVLHGENVDGAQFTAQDAAKAVQSAQSFLVLFNPSGAIARAANVGGATTNPNIYVELPDAPLDHDPAPNSERIPYDIAQSLDPVVVNFNPDTGAPNHFSPNPEVRFRAVDQLAIVELKALIRGAGVDEPWGLHTSDSYKTPFSIGTRAVQPADVWPPFRGRFDLRSPEPPLGADDPEMDEMVLAVTQWVNLNAQIIGFDSYTGVPRARQSGE